ncbi:MAG: ABC transporter permease [Acidobacteria bacterium]|nr:MAG: ABC transporter permease [Acidobacteriota bacterium]
MLRNLLDHRRLILEFAKRELKTRYTGSVAGFAWHVLNPIFLLTIYTLVFSQIMSARVPGITSTLAYTVYLCSGLLPWIAFQESISRSTSAFVENANLIKKIYVPEEIFVANVVVSSTLNLLTQLVVFLLLAAFAGFFPGVALVYLLLLILAQQAFAFGIGLTFAAANLFFRDVTHIAGMVLQAWFWMTPIVYLVDIVPERFVPWLAVNPMYHVTEGYHRIVIHGQAPSPGQWMVAISVAAASLVFSSLVLNKLRTDIRDEV